jgi:hypothetical protein
MPLWGPLPRYYVSAAFLCLYETPMEQLSGLDTAFVHQDTRRTPMHISAVLIYDAGSRGQWALDRAASCSTKNPPVKPIAPVTK